jgi:hypothetical protein
MQKKQIYTEKELVLKPEDCKLQDNRTLRRMLYRLDVEFAKKKILMKCLTFIMRR